MSYQSVCDRVSDAAAKAGRPAGAVTLIAVSKVQPEERVTAVLEAGCRVFGENRVQEAQGRWTPLRERYGDVVLHLIGPLQTNKARAAVEFFDVIQTLDRLKLAAKLADAIAATGRRPDLFVQVNTGDEAQKAGVSVGDADAFIAACRDEYGLSIRGVMAIPPADEDPTPHFRLLAEIGARNGLSDLSMGMSGDFEQAIACGATHLRVGSALFGARDAGSATA